MSHLIPSQRWKQQLGHHWYLHAYMETAYIMRIARVYPIVRSPAVTDLISTYCMGGEL